MSQLRFAIDAPVESIDEAFATEKAMARGLARHWVPEARLPKARAFCDRLIRVYWGQERGKYGGAFPLTPPPVNTCSLIEAETRLAADLGASIASFSQEEAGYLIGTIYTALLPPDLRTRLGAYYTPPCLVSRLMDQAEAAGFDWADGSALDPACGGGAFLAPLALRMVQAMDKAEPAFILASLSHRLRGFEIDPFAAWMSQTLLEIALMPLANAAGKPVPRLALTVDSLRHEPERTFSLVIGNPPYGRLTLDTDTRAKFARSLYGHANLYGVFTDQAIRWTQEGGVFAFLTPTSFLGGQYFKALRRLILDEAPPFSLEFVSDREGVFDDVLQETLLAVYRKGVSTAGPPFVAALRPKGLRVLEIETLGPVRLPEHGEEAWLLPRNRAQASLLGNLCRMPTRMKDLDYSVSTGPLVWNRHRKQLREKGGAANVYPIIWAESVRPDGFEFSHERTNHVPFIRIEKGQEWLVFDQPCVLCQRTTAKEQGRRLAAAVLPESFLRLHGCVVVENHLNMVIAGEKAVVSPETISILLNSNAADLAFRCISGSVAVSAYELNALPLPSVHQMRSLDQLVRAGATKTTLEKAIDEFYGLAAAAPGHSTS